MLNKYYVYKVNNIITDENYIGVTSDYIERVKDHLQRSNSLNGQKFQNALSTYPIENFKWEIIDSTNSKQELAFKEIYYIQKYDCISNGYNSDRGGGFKKEIYQFSSEGKLLNIYDSLKSAGSAVNASNASISHACIGGRKSCKNFYWSYDNSIKIQKDLRNKNVFQFSIEGVLLCTFNSISEASKVTGVNRSSIAKCCRNERTKAGGFLWKFAS